MLALDLIRRLYQRLERFQQRQKTRHQLRELSDHQLKDMGLSRTDALHESHKPFWRD